MHSSLVAPLRESEIALHDANGMNFFGFSGRIIAIETESRPDSRNHFDNMSSSAGPEAAPLLRKNHKKFPSLTSRGGAEGETIRMCFLRPGALESQTEAHKNEKARQYEELMVASGFSTWKIRKGSTRGSLSELRRHAPI
jgi:hypothetical protein